MKYNPNDIIEWVEPFTNDNSPVTMRVTASTAIKFIHEMHPGVYESDEDALHEFMVVYWATFVDKYDGVKERP